MVVRRCSGAVVRDGRWRERYRESGVELEREGR